jgi:hypothetical protein
MQIQRLKELERLPWVNAMPMPQGYNALDEHPVPFTPFSVVQTTDKSLAACDDRASVTVGCPREPGVKTSGSFRFRPTTLGLTPRPQRRITGLATLMVGRSPLWVRSGHSASRREIKVQTGIVSGSVARSQRRTDRNYVTLLCTDFAHLWTCKASICFP